MKRAARVISLGIVLAVAAIGLFAQADTKITGYLLGSPPNGMTDVMNALNVKLRADLKAQVEINYIGWGDLNSRYPLVLAAGGGIDWIYTADWAQYTPQAVRGAFKELTLEMLQRYMPRHYAATPKEAWDQARVNGKIFMIPTSTPDRKVPVFMIRGDLRKKYGIPPITKFSQIEAYLEAIRKNEPSLIPMNLDNGYDIGQPITALVNEFAPPNTPIQISNNATGSPFLANYEDRSRRTFTWLDEPYAGAFKRAATIIKGWYDKGYLNKNPFANTVRSLDSFGQGKSAVAFTNTQNGQQVYQKAQELGFQPEMIPILSSTGTYPADPFTNNGVAIAASSKNVEKTLQFLDLIMEEPAYDYLVYFGIEGKNYIVDKNGKIALPAGISAEQNTYPPDAAGFWFTNKDIFKPLASWSDEYIAIRGKLKGMLFNSTFTGYTFVPDKVKTEVANLTNVWTQYANPLYIGSVTNVNTAFDTLSQRLRSAGLAKVTDEIKTQVAAFARR